MKNHSHFVNSRLIFTVNICCHWTCLAHSNLICFANASPIENFKDMVRDFKLNSVFNQKPLWKVEHKQLRSWRSLCWAAKPMTNTVLKHLSNIQDTTAKIRTWSKATVIYYWLQQRDLASPKDLPLLPYRVPIWSPGQEEYMSA